MTIEFSQPGDVAAQHYNEARANGWTHEEVTQVAWEAMCLARIEQQAAQEEAETKREDRIIDGSST